MNRRHEPTETPMHVHDGGPDPCAATAALPSARTRADTCIDCGWPDTDAQVVSRHRTLRRLGRVESVRLWRPPDLAPPARRGHVGRPGQPARRRMGGSTAMSAWRLTQRYESTLGQIHWDRLGTSDAEPVVLLHGTPFSSLVWREIAPALARDHQVYVWDMPGYGRSDKSAGQDLSLKALAQVFAELIDHWRLHRPAIIAHDSGGAIALGVHLQTGVPYRQLALVDAVTLPPWGSVFGQLAGDHPTRSHNSPRNCTAPC